ncbi:hypothetical protein BG015_006417 [Linnemannia schmuckeri]|uniref:PX domain-containing protein n=1 Tax=Linnemannia schmuckeri TaxID=64567 RepID=A0A9P5VC28_9FUNG|nr:hypothetical protein BG015_006417 [Linnemannia schmuckeri]
MASSYSSAKLAPPISGAAVDAFEIGPDHQLWYNIQVHPCPMTIPGSNLPSVLRKSYSICRRHGDVADFVERLEEEFPWLKAYQDESQNNTLYSFREKGPTWSSNKSRDGTTLFDASRSLRQQELNRYFQTLFTLESIVIQCRLVSEFFGIWKTDFQFHLSQENQVSLALHSIAPVAPVSSKNSALDNGSSYCVDPRARSYSSLLTPSWSPDNMSSSSSAHFSPPTSPTMPSSPENKRGCFFWDTPLNLLDLSAINRRNIVSPPRSSFDSSCDSEDSDDASSYYSDASDGESDTYSMIMSKFPKPPYTLQTSTSLQNSRKFLQRCPSPSPSYFASSSSSSSSSLPLPLLRTPPPSPPVIPIHPQHRPLKSFGEGTLQCELSSPLDSIPPRTASLVMNTLGSGMGPSISPRRPSSVNPEVPSHKAHQAHTRTPSNPINNTHNSNSNNNNNYIHNNNNNSSSSSSSNSTVSISIPPKSATRLIAKAQAYVSSSPFSTSPPLTVPARSISKPVQGIAVQPKEKKTKETTPLSLHPRVGSKAATITTAPLNPKPAKTSTAPLSPKAREPIKRILTSQKPPSIITDSISGISNFTINLNPSASLVSPASPNPQSISESRAPQSIIATLNQAHAQKQLSSKVILAQQKRQQQQQDRFAATIKVVVNAHMIIALKILEEETGFMLSVPDLRLRVLNKFRRMSMAIPDEFDLVWVGGDGSQVVLKNDEEIQKALKVSINNKLTLRCIF